MRNDRPAQHGIDVAHQGNGIHEITADLYGYHTLPPEGAYPASVLIALLEGHGSIHTVVEGFARQTASLRCFEVIVVDDGQDPANIEHLKLLDPTIAQQVHLRVFKTGGTGRAHANNVAFQQSCGSLVLFSAADFIPTPPVVQAHLDFHHSNPAVTAVGIGAARFTGESRKDAFCSWLEDTGRLFGVSFTQSPVDMAPTYFYIGHASLKRDFVVQTGPFDEDFLYDTTEDYEYSLRLEDQGMRSAFLPDAVSFHDHRLSFKERCRAMRRAGISTALLVSKHPAISGIIEDATRTSAKHYAAAGYYGLLHWLLRSADYQEKYWINRLAADFMAGYEDAARVSRTWRPGQPTANHIQQI